MTYKEHRCRMTPDFSNEKLKTRKRKIGFKI